MSKTQKSTNGVAAELLKRKVYLVGGGIGSLAAAAYLIKDGGIAGSNITIFESTPLLGGSLDAHGDPETGYIMRGGRMFAEHYVCTYDLLSFIPSIDDPANTAKDEIMLFHEKWGWNDKARLVDNDGKIMDAHHFGFSARDRLELIKMTTLPESAVDGKRISECFSPEFFETNFWYMWRTIFAFELWHSAVELRRYFLRFIDMMPTMDTMTSVYRTKYNQYDSMIRPIVKWLRERDVKFVNSALVTNIDFKPGSKEITATTIHLTQGGQKQEISLGEHDVVMVTNGSMVADATLGTTTTVPETITDKRDGSWALWEKLAAGRPEFGNPSVFNSHVDESKWESFTVTMNDPIFFDLMEKFSGNPAGKGGLLTLRDSAWLLTTAFNKQPHYYDQPEGVWVFWALGLFPDKIGDYVKKPMAKCTGAEILEEFTRHLKFDADLKKIMESSIVIPCMMPYVTSQFLVRKAGDRPQVVPKGSTNFAFLGQFAELPDDVVFTVDYSVRSAQTAVFTLLGLDKKPTPFYHGMHDPKVLWAAATTMER